MQLGLILVIDYYLVLLHYYACLMDYISHENNEIDFNEDSNDDTVNNV